MGGLTQITNRGRVWERDVPRPTHSAEAFGGSVHGGDTDYQSILTPETVHTIQGTNH